jgi:microcystin-dependent protein
MPGWNGSGTFNREYSWVADAAAGIDISSSRMDSDTNLIAGPGFSNCLTRDGQGSATANLPMNGNKHTGAANGTASTDYATYGQLQSAALTAGLTNWVIAAGTSDAITADYDPAIAELVDGQVCYFRATAANLTTTPSFSPNGLSAETITKNGGQALAVGDICGSLNEVTLRYNIANTRWELLNPPSTPIGGAVPYFGGSVPSGFALPLGQNLATATYPAASTVLGTTYGSPGGGNFTMPDGRGRVFAHLDSGGSGRITVAGGNFDGTTLGTAGGAQNQTIGQTNLPSVNFTASVSDPGHYHGAAVRAAYSTTGQSLSAGGNFPMGSDGAEIYNTTANNYFAGGSVGSSGGFINLATTGISVSVASGGSGTALPIVQPAMVINWMMRIA